MRSAGRSTVQALNALGDSIRDYDFEAALAKLDTIVQELGLNAGKATA